MDRFVFIHGSSIGKSSFIPHGTSLSLCDEICDSYFKGREARCKESDADKALFVELCNDSRGNNYVCYSYVNNRCVGAAIDGKEGRPGQYFAISVLSTNYVFPEPVYLLLSAAYKQLFEGKIIDSQSQFLINQFNEKKDDLEKAAAQIDKFFDDFSQGRPIKKGSTQADYSSWKGEKYNLDLCNSEQAFDTLCRQGRIYISQEYESSTAKIKTLEKRIDDLQKEKIGLEEQMSKKATTERSKNRQELDEVSNKLKEEKTKSERLQVENERYKESLKVVKTELEKYGKLGESIHSLQNQHSKYGKKDKKDLLKILLLVLILIFTLISSILSYAFFRSLPSNPKDGKTTEKTEQHQDCGKNESEAESEVEKESENESEVVQLSFEVSDNGKLDFGAEGKKTKSITITTNGTWACPSVPDKDKGWIELIKDGDKLNVTVKEANPKTTDRTSKIMITSTLADQSLEKQITITQKKKIEETSANDYGLTITNSSGVKLMDGDVVKKGDKLKAKVTKNTSQSTEWDVKGCSEIGDGIKNNQADISLTVNANGGESVTISYGSKTNPKQRQTVTLTVKIDNDEKKSDIENGVQPITNDSARGG